MAEIQTNMYDLNKESMSQIEPLDPIWFNKRCKDIADKITYSGSKFWLLLNRERYDITMFVISMDGGTLAQELIECLNNRGSIIDLTEREDGSYEIWIRDLATKENFVYYLFNYENGVIEV